MLWDTGQAHGDRVHLSDIDPARPGQEIFYIQEFNDVYTNPISLRDARTGALIWGPTADWGDVGRGIAADFDGAHPGMEMFASTGEFYSATGTVIGPRPNVNPNMAIWWDADLSRELLDGNSIRQYDGEGENFTAAGCTSNNGTKSSPTLSADVLGDWREEVIFHCGDSIRIFTTNQVAGNRIYTLMHDPQYRVAISWQNVEYSRAVSPTAPLSVRWTANGRRAGRRV